MRVLAMLCTVLAGAAAAQEFSALPGFSADLDRVCGLGRDLQAGCEAIRDREILDAGAAPWQAVGRVNFATVEARRHCTGTLVADDIILTAAHCLRDPDGGLVPPPAVTFVAGYQRGESEGSARAVEFFLGDASQSGRPRPAEDWALVRLDAPLGATVGILPLSSGDRAEEALLAGYPALRAHVLSVSACGRIGLVQSGLHVVRCAAMPGDSGAPVVVMREGAPEVVAVMSSIVTAEGELATLAVPVAAFQAALTQLTQD